MIRLNLPAVCTATLSIACLAPTASAQVIQNPDLTRLANETFKLTASSVVTLDVVAEVGQPFTADIPIGGEIYTVEMFPNSQRAESFQVYHMINGEMVPVDSGPSRTLLGQVRGLEGSRVTGSLYDEGLRLTVNLPHEGKYTVQPLPLRIPGAPAGSHVIYHRDNVIAPEGECGVDPELGMDGNGDQGGAAAGGVNCSIYVTEIAIDADFPYFQDFGANTESHIEDIVNDMDEDQYLPQVQIDHEITTILVRTSSDDDPYNCANFNCPAGSLLNEFRSWWLSNGGGIPRDVTYLFTGRSLQGGTIGIAFDIGAICTNNAYCLGENLFNFNCDTDLMAHELGHLWGCFHCSCPSNTMNPGLTCANNFSAGSINSIVNHRNSRTCLECTVPNDVCEGSTPIGSGTGVFNTSEAQSDGFSESCGSFPNDVWFQFFADCPPAQPGTATVTLCGSPDGLDTEVAAYFGCPTGPNQALACSNDFCGTNSEITFDIFGGLLYRIRIGGDAAIGVYDLSFDCGVEPPECPWDIDGDGEVGATDLSALIIDWDCTDPPGPCPGDVNGDGNVNAVDLSDLIVNWGPCPDE